MCLLRQPHCQRVTGTGLAPGKPGSCLLHVNQVAVTCAVPWSIDKARSATRHAFCSACMLHAPSWCCRFVLGHQLVASAVVGASTLQQLQELLQAAAQGPLQDEQLLAAIDSIHQRYPSPTP